MTVSIWIRFEGSSGLVVQRSKTEARAGY